MLEIIVAGGWVMLPILLCSVIALAIGFERAWALNRRRILPDNLLIQVWGWIKNNQIEACRVAITRYLKRKGRVFIRIFPHKPVTARPPETRMGKGKGAPEFWVAVVKPGHMLFEVSGVPESTAREACRLAANKLGVRTRFVSRGGTAA